MTGLQNKYCSGAPQRKATAKELVTWRREQEKEKGFKYSWKKMAATVQDIARWSVAYVPLRATRRKSLYNYMSFSTLMCVLAL